MGSVVNLFIRLLKEKDVNLTINKDENIFDGRLIDVIELLKAAPLKDVVTVLDIGAGKGELAKYFSRLGKKVTCTGVHIKSYLSEVNSLLDEYGIEYVECDVEEMPFPDASFDMVVMSHVLEHCPNVGIALSQARRVLKQNGLLLIFVPPAENIVCAGHISVGWNVGQLMYVLLLNGFDVKNGSFIEYGYNICGFVKPSSQPLPELRHDQGDITLLKKKRYIPESLTILNEDSFNGCIRSINWPDEAVKSLLQKKSRLKYLLILALSSITSARFRSFIGNFLLRMGKFFIKLS